MPSIAQVIIDKYNGVVDCVQTTISDAADKGITALNKTSKVAPLTEEELSNKELIRSALKDGVWTIHFKKVDGTLSVMDATLDPSVLPPIDPVKINVRPRNEDAEPEHLLHVYATDRGGWRSFVVNNVIKIDKKE